MAETKVPEPFFNFTDGRFFVSSATIDGINPKADLLAALQSIRDKQALTATQERVLAGFWPELVHQRQPYWQQIGSLPPENIKREVAELTTEFIARHTYQRFLRALGDIKPLYQADIIKESIGYQVSITRFDALLNKLQIAPKDILPLMELVNKDNMKTVIDNVAHVLAVRSGKSAAQIQTVLEAIKDGAKFDNQLAALKAV